MYCPTHTKDERIVSKAIGICGDCLRQRDEPPASVMRVHQNQRLKDGLAPLVPAAGDIVCPDCGNHCRMVEGQRGFCNLRAAERGEVVHRFGKSAVVSWYFDPLPTNCVADWVCRVKDKRMTDDATARLKNLAVFYGSCNSDCLFCQNASYRLMMAAGRPLMSPEQLADVADDRTACVCYFGGDPACNPRHALDVSEILYDRWQLKVCYETNGNMSSQWLVRTVNMVKKSGGTLKFDLKAVTPSLYSALTGVSNGQVLRNFRKVAAMMDEPDGSSLVASILLIPGYLDLGELHDLFRFIASCGRGIPTALLGFSPKYLMSDLPRTSRAHAQAAYAAAKEEGLENVRIGNTGLLGTDSYRFD